GWRHIQPTGRSGGKQGLPCTDLRRRSVSGRDERVVRACCPTSGSSCRAKLLVLVYDHRVADPGGRRRSSYVRNWEEAYTLLQRTWSSPARGPMPLNGRVVRRLRVQQGFVVHLPEEIDDRPHWNRSCGRHSFRCLLRCSSGRAGPSPCHAAS